jgi:hypothetical protein
LFLMIIFVAIFLFHAVLIDYARVMAFERATENATRAGVRSVLSSYDGELQNIYGLYGVGKNNGQKIFTKVMEKQLEQSPGYFHFIDPNLEKESITVKYDYMLGHHQVFERQILEEMKYKAPIDFNLELIDRLSPLSDALKEASSTMKVLKDLKKVYEIRENNLNSLLENQKEALRLISPQTLTTTPIESLLGKHKSLLEEAFNRANATKQKNEELKQRVEEEAILEGEQYDQVIERTTPASAVPQKEMNAMKSIDNGLENMIYEESFFQNIEQRLQQQKIELQDLEQAISSVEDEVSLGQEKYISKVTLLINEQLHEMNSLQQKGNKSELEKNQKEAENNLKGINQLINQFKRMNTKTKDYQEISKYLAQYATFNQQTRIHKSPTIQEVSSADDASDNAMNSMDALFTGLADQLSSIRNDLYINEFILSKFTHVDPSFLMEATRDNKKEAINKLMDSKQQQIEYILYGLDSPGANIVAALTEMFTLRLAINTLESIPDCTGLGHPIAIFQCVLAKSLGKTLQDMNKIMEGEPIKLSKYVPVEFTYKDHLRLFLFIHSGEERRLLRMQALIQHSTGKNLTEVPSYVKTEVKSSIKLWFLPSAMKILQYTGAIDGNVKGNRYFTKKVAVMSY